MKSSKINLTPSNWRNAVGFVGLALAAFSTMFVAESAQAQLKVCNKSGKTAFVAVAYAGNNANWISEGWYEINPRKCETVVDTKLVSGDFYYLYASDRNDAWVWEGKTDQLFCVHPTDQFDYSTKKDSECGGGGTELRPFWEVKVDGTSYTENLGK